MKRIRFAVPIFLFVIIWELISRSNIVNIALFPPPSSVLVALVEMQKSGELLRDIGSSYLRVFIGFSWGASIGIMLGLLTGRIKPFSDALVPIIQLVRPLPPVAIIPLVIVWFGIGELAKIFSIGFAVFFPVWLATFLGAKQIPERLLWSARTLTRSRLKMFHEVIFPATLPFIVAGLRTGIAISFVMVFVSELAGASSGIGYQISISHLAYRIDRMVASLVILGISGALADLLFSLAATHIFPWLSLVRTN